MTKLLFWVLTTFGTGKFKEIDLWRTINFEDAPAIQPAVARGYLTTNHIYMQLTQEGLDYIKESDDADKTTA